MNEPSDLEAPACSHRPAGAASEELGIAPHQSLNRDSTLPLCAGLTNELVLSGGWRSLGSGDVGDGMGGRGDSFQKHG